jgi:hypothetical protein
MTSATESTIVYSTVIRTPGALSGVEVQASLGTQTIGRASGIPIDASDPGPTTITITGDDGVTTTLTVTDALTVELLADALHAAEKARYQRDRTLDAPRGRPSA